jgi:hypothetical protein
MIPETILKESKSAGVILTLTDTNDLKANGNREAISRWLPTLKEHKSAIIQELQIEMIKTWLASINEPIEDWHLVLGKSRRDPDAMSFFLKLARGEPIDDE